MIEQKALFVACARDCAVYLPRVLSNVSRMAGLFAETAFLFLENDSRDNTKQELALWCRDRANARLISLDGLTASRPVRTVRLAFARNHCLSLVRSQFSNYDFLFVVDSDDVNAQEIDLNAMTRAIEFLQRDARCAGVFANSLPNYYDMWALRHRERCPGDVWEEVCDYAIGRGVPDEEAFSQTFAKRIFSMRMDDAPLEVDSAFGGLGIYKVPSVLRNKREYVGYSRKLIRNSGGPAEYGWQRCEHVSFNTGFREIDEKLFVLPELVNWRAGELSFPPSAWRTLLFDLRAAGGPASNPPNPAKIGRNQPCPCGSGKKFKHCHGR
jgi:hypothetical protein